MPCLPAGCRVLVSSTRSRRVGGTNRPVRFLSDLVEPPSLIFSVAGVVFFGVVPGLIVATDGVTGSDATLWSSNILTADGLDRSSTFSFVKVFSSGAVAGVVEATSFVTFVAS